MFSAFYNPNQSKANKLNYIEIAFSAVLGRQKGLLMSLDVTPYTFLNKQMRSVSSYRSCIFPITVGPSQSQGAFPNGFRSLKVSI